MAAQGRLLADRASSQPIAPTMNVVAMMLTQATFGSPRNAKAGVMTTSVRQYSQQLPENMTKRTAGSIIAAA
jgi:hypothetical protein